MHRRCSKAYAKAKYVILSKKTLNGISLNLVSMRDTQARTLYFCNVQIQCKIPNGIIMNCALFKSTTNEHSLWIWLCTTECAI